jgi:biopolymer transport protein ExbD
MIDFLFLMLAFFATLAVTRTALYDTQLEMVQLQKAPSASPLYPQDPLYQIHLSVSREGLYKWITEIHDYPLETVDKLQKELVHQYETGLLPLDKSQTQVLLHIDKNAPWEAVAKLIFSIREIGFEANPVYTAKDDPLNRR